MPETAVSQNDLPARWKHNIRSAGQVLAVEPESVSKPVNQTAQNNFRTSVLAADTRHICAASLRADFIHQTTKAPSAYAVKFQHFVATPVQRILADLR